MSDRAGWPDGPLLAYYGDDFTGSTDAMEAMTAAGVPDRAVPRPPDADAARRASRRARCIGIAGIVARPQPGMDGRRTAASLRVRWQRIGAPILHYKVCSTFDSSPSDRLDRPRDRHRRAH